ncbi:MAG: hypothetical protein MUC88_12995, partial [Planctomycetes bacterium]|nr:hypothetical protein [Planctomycetota bacterium]
VGVFLWMRSRSLRPDDIWAVFAKQPADSPLTLVYPRDGTVFPPEIVPPTFRWENAQAQASVWLVRVETDDGRAPLACLVRQCRWTPTAQEWEAVKKGSTQSGARVRVIGVETGRRIRIVSAATATLRTATDVVGAPVFYREVNLPFIDAVTDPSKIRWRFGSIGSPEPPPVILTGLPVCGNCHSFARDSVGIVTPSPATAGRWRWMWTTPTAKARTSSRRSSPR